MGPSHSIHTPAVKLDEKFMPKRKLKTQKHRVVRNLKYLIIGVSVNEQQTAGFSVIGLSEADTIK